jgi:hypothetical protein
MQAPVPPPRSPLSKTRSKWDIFSSKSPEEVYKMHLKETDEEVAKNTEMMNLIQQLKAERDEKDQLIHQLNHQIELLSRPQKPSDPSSSIHRKHQFTTETHLISDNTENERIPLATRGSILTTNILRALPTSESTTNPTRLLVEKFLLRIKKPLEHLVYLQSSEFGSDLIELCLSLCDLLENEPRCHFLQSPVYVIGDIHGNLEDLHFFSDNLWKLGLELSAGKFLFLGDYVDRGMNCLECVAYLFALKVLCPNKIFLLR